MANFSDGPAAAALPGDQDWAAAELLLSNYPPADGAPAGAPAGIAAPMTLRAWEARVYQHSGRAHHLNFQIEEP